MKAKVERACVDCGVKRMVDAHHTPDRCKRCSIKRTPITLKNGQGDFRERLRYHREDAL